MSRQHLLSVFESARSRTSLRRSLEGRRRRLAVEEFEARVVPTAYTWSQTGAGTFNWDDAANWGGAGTPSVAGDTATFPNTVVGAQVVNVNVAETLASITLSTGAGGALTLQTGTAGSLSLTSITDNSTAANIVTISVPVTLTGAGTYSNTSPGTMIDSGAITLGANILTVSGTGPMTINGG